MTPPVHPLSASLPSSDDPQTPVATRPDGVIVLTRRMNAPADLVWQVWTEPAHIAKWWGPPDVVITGCVIDLRVGGKMSITMRGADGNEYPSCGTIRVCDPGRRLVIEGDDGPADGEGAGFPARALVTVTLVPDGAATLLTVETVFDTAAARTAATATGYGIYWAISIDRMARLLETD